MHTLFLLSVLVCSTGVLVSAGTLDSSRSSDLLTLLQAIQDSDADSGIGDEVATDVDDDGADSAEDGENWSVPCCLPYVWQSKVIAWDGLQSMSSYSFFDYPGRRMASYTITPAVYGYIAKETDDNKYLDSYVFNKTTCVHYRSNYTMLPTCLPKWSKSIGPFKLGPPVNGRGRLITRAWSIGNGRQEELVTLRSSDCAPVDATMMLGSNMYTEYFTNVKTYIDYPSVFDVPSVCYRPMTAYFGASELEKMKLVGRSILSRFGMEQRV